ncbi:hypothetical protein B0H11DRAFT_2123454 [Mycena galericulata]|nr:hypothetical protein B0H11DRAFT_2123454 [Mycena galericulata]
MRRVSASAWWRALRARARAPFSSPCASLFYGGGACGVGFLDSRIRPFGIRSLAGDSRFEIRVACSDACTCEACTDCTESE